MPQSAQDTGRGPFEVRFAYRYPAGHESTNGKRCDTFTAATALMADINNYRSLRVYEKRDSYYDRIRSLIPVKCEFTGNAYIWDTVRNTMIM